jgi:hypothetical protein
MQQGARTIDMAVEAYKVLEIAMGSKPPMGALGYHIGLQQAPNPVEAVRADEVLGLELDAKLDQQPPGGGVEEVAEDAPEDPCIIIIFLIFFFYIATIAAV